jgi:hypothetical protein
MSWLMAILALVSGAQAINCAIGPALFLMAGEDDPCKNADLVYFDTSPQEARWVAWQDVIGSGLIVVLCLLVWWFVWQGVFS